MATFTAARGAATFPAFQSHEAGSLCVAMGTINIAANPTAPDIYEMCRVPAGATVVGGTFYLDDIDTNATETLDMNVGWLANADESADADGFGNFGVLTGDVLAEYQPEAGTVYPLGGVLITAGPKTFTAETTLAVDCVATAATFTAGQMTLVVYYFVS